MSIFNLSLDKKKQPASYFSVLSYGGVCVVVTLTAMVARKSQVRVPGLWLVTWVAYSVASAALAGLSALLNVDTISASLDTMAFGSVVHVVCMAFFIYKRHHGGGQPQWHPSPQAPVAGGPVHTIMSADLTCCEKCWVYTIGWFIKQVELIIWFVANFGLDLAPFFFPLPFYNFYQAQLMTRHYRFFHERYRIRLHAGHADSYFLWLLEKILNFVTLSLYKKIMARRFPSGSTQSCSGSASPPQALTITFESSTITALSANG